MHLQNTENSICAIKCIFKILKTVFALVKDLFENARKYFVFLAFFALKGNTVFVLINVVPYNFLNTNFSVLFQIYNV